MSVYNRKGGAGRNTDLRQQFNYYKLQLKKRLIKEQAFGSAVTKTFEPRPSTLFKNLEYNKIYTEGVTRKIRGATKRFFGEEAIKIQIQSFSNRASKSYQATAFINNYIRAAENAGFSDELINYIETSLNSLSVDRLSILIKRGVLPQIYFLYSLQEDEDEFKERFTNAIKYGALSPAAQDIRKQILNYKNKPKLSRAERSTVAELTKELNKVNNEFLKTVKENAKRLEKSFKTIFDIQGW